MSEIMSLSRSTSSRHGNRSSRCAGVAAAAIVGAVAGSPGLASDDPFSGEPISGQGVLELMPGTPIGPVLDRYGLTLLDQIPSRDLYLVDLNGVLTESQFEQLFFLDTEVDHSELNFASGDPGPGTQSIFLSVPPFEFDSQPVRGALGLPDAHALATGAGTVIAVIDSGVDARHPALLGSIAPGGISYVGSAGGDANTSDVGNGADDDGDGLIDEMVGHGTFVAALARMVAPSAGILPIRVLDDEGLTTSFTVIKGIYHAIDSGADVINLSLGSRTGEQDLRYIERAIDDAVDLGIVVIASAGNNASELPEFPAAFNKAGGTAATDNSGRVAPFSNVGDHVFMSAPGVRLVSAVPGGGYAEADGTSFAAPLLAGTAALMIERGTVLRWDNFRGGMRQTAVDIEAINPDLPDDAMGFGMLDIRAAVAWDGPCHADVLEDDSVDILDVVTFIDLWTLGEPEGDIAEPRGAWDIMDVLSFLGYWNSGCP